MSEENQEEEQQLRFLALNLRYLCLALGMKFTNAYKAKKQLDIIHMTLKNDMALPPRIKALGSFMKVKLSDKYEDFKTELIKNNQKLQEEVCIAFFDYYDTDGDGKITKKELEKLFIDIGKDNEGIWGKKDLAEFYTCFLIETETKKDIPFDKFLALMKELKVEPSKNIIEDAIEMNISMRTIEEFDPLKKLLFGFYGIEKVEDEDKNDENFNNVHKEGRGFIQAILNVLFTQFDKDKDGLLNENDLKDMVPFIMEINDEEVTTESIQSTIKDVINQYYDDFLGDVLTYYAFIQYVGAVIKKGGGNDSDDDGRDDD